MGDQDLADTLELREIQSIRNIIPHITDTTNNILGQMTGGTMGVEFVMERTVKENQEIYHWLVRTFTEFNAGIQNTASTCSHKEHVNESVYGGNGRLVRRDG